MRSTPAWFLLIVTLSGGTGLAQEKIGVVTSVLFYGDNTEFHGPFREGETLFGASGRIAAAIDVNDKVTVTLGVSGNHRFGGAEFDRIRPVASLSVTGGTSTFVFGTLPPAPRSDLIGPDRGGPHALLPPLQRETLTFERPQEDGLQWTRRGAGENHEGWLNWQRLNTAKHRERFDVGLNGSASVAPAAAIGYQLHVVHEGGQLFASGPVRDSQGYAAGLVVGHPAGPFERISIEGWGLLSRDVPDRQTPSASLTGKGLFLRLAVERNGWRGHAIVWRGRNFIKDEGDRNYQSILHDGSRYHGIRDYSEVGLARRYHPAPRVWIEASFRGHRIERHYDYSYRILANADLKLK